MTYCLAIKVEEGLVLASDSRTNAGVDHVSTYSKMHTFVWPKNRYFVLLSSGNLATTQAVVKRMRSEADHDAGIFSAPDMDAVAAYVGRLSTDIQKEHREMSNSDFEATFLLGGQIDGQPPEIFLIYPQGNYIHESADHPYLQMGETKYGKPILDRVIRRDTPLELAGRCALVSINSTIRSNLTVGPPIELLLFRNGGDAKLLSLSEHDPFYRALNDAWNEGLKHALNGLPKFEWEEERRAAQYVQEGGSGVMR